MPDHRSHERDRRLRRVNQITGATLAGGIALTAGWSVAAAHSSGGTPASPPTSVAVDGGAQTPTTGATAAPENTQAAQAQTPAPAAPATTVAPDQQQAQPDTQPTSPPITSARRHQHQQSAPVSGGS